MDGKALADIIIETKLEALARDNDIEPLVHYIQQTPEQLEEILLDMNLPRDNIPKQKYFCPEKGLSLIEEHIKMVKKEELWIGKDRILLILNDLNECKKIFKYLIGENISWYFAYDF